MSLRRPKPEPPAVTSDRLSGVRAHRHDEDDDRPSREDLKPAGSQFFKMPFELPRFLKMKRER
jgi:hypothetical protein